MLRHFLHLMMISFAMSCLPTSGQMVGTINMQFGESEGAISLPSTNEKTAAIIRSIEGGGFYTTQSHVHPASNQTEVRRFSREGAPDKAFGDAGIRAIALEGSVLDFQVDSDRNLFLCGYVQRGRKKDVWVLKLKEDGRTDPEFGIQGVVTLTIQEQDVAQRLRILSSGHLLIAGTTYTPSQLERDLFVIKLDAKGRMDLRFGHRGSAIIDLSKDDRLKDFQLTEDGRMVLAGNSRPNRLSRFSLVRLLENGRKDPSFGLGGTQIMTVGNGQSYLQAMQLLPDGNIVVAGNARMNPADPGFDLVVIRLLPEGQYDPSFANHGTFSYDMGGVDYFGDLTMQPDQQMIISGMNGKEVQVFRVRQNGKLDPTYGQKGVCRIDGSERITSVRSVLNSNEHLLLSTASATGSKIYSLFGNPQLPFLDELLDFDWSSEEEDGISYSGLQFSDDIQIDAWLGGSIFSENEPATGTESILPITKHIRFFAHLALDEDHRYTFVWDSEGQAHWYWNGSFQNSWDLLNHKK